MIKLKVKIVPWGKQTSGKAMNDVMFSVLSFSCAKDKQLNSKMLLGVAFNRKICPALFDFRRQQMDSCLEQDVI